MKKQNNRIKILIFFLVGLVVVGIGIVLFLSLASGGGDLPPVESDTVTQTSSSTNAPTQTSSPTPLPTETTRPEMTLDDEPATQDTGLSNVAMTATALTIRQLTASVTPHNGSTGGGTPSANTEVVPPVNGSPSNTPFIAETILPTLTEAVSGEEPTEQEISDDELAGTVSAQMTQDIIQQTVTGVPVAAGVNPSDAVGAANVYPFYDNEATYPDTTIIELSLIFTSLNITATPYSAVTRVPITPGVPLPDVVGADLATLTPRPAQAQFELEDVPPRIVAVLVCLERSFTGCTTQPPREVEIGIDNRWQWIISPNEGVSGRQNLRLELYEARTDGTMSSNPLWQYSFAIDVKSAASPFLTSNIGMITVGLILLVAILLGGYTFSTRRTQPPADKRKPKPRVFISYRRAVGRADARAIHDNLTMNGVDAFLDVDDIHAGAFNEHIQQNIRESDYFIVILAPGTLESEWVCKEVQYAFDNDKLIVPILVNGFDLYGGEIPDDLQGLQQQNALTLTAENFKFIISKLLEWMGIER